MQGVVGGRGIVGSAVTVFEEPIVYGPEAKAGVLMVRHVMAMKRMRGNGRGGLRQMGCNTGRPPDGENRVSVWNCARCR